MSKRLQSSAKTFSIFNNKKTNSKDHEDAQSSKPRKSVGESSSKSKKPTSGFGFLSLEQSMNDKTLQVFKNNDYVCIRDKYPKSRVHLLLIPLPNVSDGIKLTKVEQVIAMPKAITFLKNMQDLASEIIKSSVIKPNESYPQSSDIRIGNRIVKTNKPCQNFNQFYY